MIPKPGVDLVDKRPTAEEQILLLSYGVIPDCLPKASMLANCLTGQFFHIHTALGLVAKDFSWTRIFLYTECHNK